MSELLYLKPVFLGKKRIYLMNYICSPRFFNPIGLNEINSIKLDLTRSNQITPDQIDFMRFNVPTYVVTVPTVNMFFINKLLLTTYMDFPYQNYKSQTICI